jgi:hypothetical protein
MAIALCKSECVVAVYPKVSDYFWPDLYSPHPCLPYLGKEGFGKTGLTSNRALVVQADCDRLTQAAVFSSCRYSCWQSGMGSIAGKEKLKLPTNKHTDVGSGMAIIANLALATGIVPERERRPWRYPHQLFRFGCGSLINPSNSTVPIKSPFPHYSCILYNQISILTQKQCFSQAKTVFRHFFCINLQGLKFIQKPIL